jgi:hypothetical protein
LADGSEAHVLPDGKVIAVIARITIGQENAIHYTEESVRQHLAAVMAFKKSRTYRREIRRLRPRPRPARRPHAHGRARRERCHVARSTSSSDPGDDHPPPPAWLECPVCTQPLIVQGDDAICAGCPALFWGWAR